MMNIDLLTRGQTPCLLPSSLASTRSRRENSSRMLLYTRRKNHGSPERPSSSSSGILQIRCDAAKSRRSSGVQTTTTTSKEPFVAVDVTVTVERTIKGFLDDIGIDMNDIKDLFGRTLSLELVSSELDPKTGEEKKTSQAFAQKIREDLDDIKYEAHFKVPKDFGVIGAVLAVNEHDKEMYFKDIVLETAGENPVTIVCNSFVHAKTDSTEKRVFFVNKTFLPEETPKGLERWRKKELEIKRGDGRGERKLFERIYDYDVYNDLGTPDDEDLVRPVLGGSKEYPYPRRCRTGRPKTNKDPKTETRTSKTWYVPRDEAFSEVKSLTFQAKTVRSVLKSVIPAINAMAIDKDLGFPFFAAIDQLYKEGFEIPSGNSVSDTLRTVIPRIIKTVDDKAKGLIKFEEPAVVERDKFAWFRDEEFGRQTLAGVNPCTIRLVTPEEFPFKSNLDPKIYGPTESLLTEELINKVILGIMTAGEAIEQKRLFILDYHDALLPYVLKVRELEGTTLYGSRTLFFLMPGETLRPIAIELTRPESPTLPQWKQVFMPSWDATGDWLWRLAKVHACAHDAGIHQLISHWLRTHCCVEPYIIAANRQLSILHPVYRLMHPHFRYTMEINALAREALINAGGIIESSFSPQKYSIEISSGIYGQQWRFDMESLPADLIRRGMAVEDPNSEHGVKLTIEDYPYAADGLLIWSAIKDWVRDYITHYYKSSDQIKDDEELQAFWTEVRTKGHADKKDEPWWPKLETPEDLVQILTTMIWVASGHHAAVNFGQYHYGGYFPNRPTVARTNMPVEDLTTSDNFMNFVKKPEEEMLKCFPSQAQATQVIAVLDVLSNHSPDEEYIGGEPEVPWKNDQVIAAAYERFSGRMKQIEGIIDGRNADMNLKNRWGAGIVPYELLKPHSEPGVTGMGIPSSISI